MDFPSPINKLTEQTIVTLLQTHRNALAAAWYAAPNVHMLCERFEIDETLFYEEIATAAMEHFITLFKGEKCAEGCPAMRKMVHTFYHHGLNVEDLFIFCTALKNSVIALCFREHAEAEVLTRITTIFDYNLATLLGIYTEKLEKSEEMLTVHGKIIEEHVLLSVTDFDGRIIHVTDAFCELTGYSEAEWKGKTHALIRHPDMPDGLFELMWDMIKSGKEWKGIIKNRKKNGQTFIAKTRIAPVKDSAGNIIEYIAIREDVTDKELINYDPLTKIYNRRMFDKLYTNLMQTALLDDSTFCVIIADIDHFKHINDRFGHQEGDEVLIRLTKILRKNLRKGDSCARWGGEEFLVLLPNTDLEQGLAIAERIRRSVELNLKAKKEVQTCSIGIAQLQTNDSDISLFKRADTALYKAKRSGRNCVIGL